MPFRIHSGLLLVRHCPSCLHRRVACRLHLLGVAAEASVEVGSQSAIGSGAHTPLIQRRWLRVWHRLAVDYCSDACPFVTTIRRQQRWCFRQLRLVGNCTLGRVQSLSNRSAPQESGKTQQRIHLHTARSSCLQLWMSVVRVVLRIMQHSCYLFVLTCSRALAVCRTIDRATPPFHVFCSLSPFYRPPRSEFRDGSVMKTHSICL